MNRHLLLDWTRRHPTTTALVAVALAALGAGILAVNLSRRIHNPEMLFQAAREARIAAETQLQSNRPADAERACRRALAALETLTARWPRRRSYRREWAVALDTIGLIHVAQDQTREAEHAYVHAIYLWGYLIGEDQTAVDIRWRMAACLNRLAALLRGAGRWEDAEHELVRGRILCQTRVPNMTVDRRVDQQLVAIFIQLARLFQETGRWHQAIENYVIAARIQQGLLQSSSATGQERELLVSLLIDQARVYTSYRQPGKAERVLAEALDHAGRFRTEFPAAPRYDNLAATVLNELADTIKTNPKRVTEARDLLERAMPLLEKLAVLYPSESDYLANLAATCCRLADLYRGEKRLEKAEALERQELLCQSRLEKEHPDDIAFRFGHGRALHNLANVLRERGRPDLGLPLEQEAVRRLGSIHRENVLDPEYRRALSHACWALCALQVDRKDHRAAAQAVAEYLRIEPTGYEEAQESAGFLCRCAQLCRADRSIAAAERESLAISYADQAMSALRTAVRNGFREALELKTSPTYELLRGRDDFQRLVGEVEVRAEAVKQAR
ncbi:MAG: hypothetical protein ACHRXM_25205 [Isosphaerales bacterium]